MHGAWTTLGYKCSYRVVARETGEYHGSEYLHAADGMGLILGCELVSIECVAVSRILLGTHSISVTLFMGLCLICVIVSQKHSNGQGAPLHTAAGQNGFNFGIIVPPCGFHHLGHTCCLESSR